MTDVLDPRAKSHKRTGAKMGCRAASMTCSVPPLVLPGRGRIADAGQRVPARHCACSRRSAAIPVCRTGWRRPTRLCEGIGGELPNAISFTSKLIFATDNWFMRLLRNQAALAVRRRLHLEGLRMVILPLKVRGNSGASATVVKKEFTFSRVLYL